MILLLHIAYTSIVAWVVNWASSWENLFYAYLTTKVQISCLINNQLISPFTFASKIPFLPWSKILGI